jgi:hypothetical protein
MRTRIVVHVLLAAASLVIGAGVLVAGLRSGSGSALVIAGGAVGAAGLAWMALVLLLPRRPRGGARGSRR